jgi:hypothetical protein
MRFKQPFIVLAITVTYICGLFIACGCQFSKASIIRRVDHVLIASSDAGELFSLLSDKFEFPVVWPMANYGRFTSGGVFVGNLNLEVVRTAVSEDKTNKSRFVGIALEPEPLQHSLEELDARKIAHGSAIPFVQVSSDSAAKTLWSTVMLPGLSDESTVIFLCEYSHDVEAQRQHNQDQLQVISGGPISVESVREIVIGATDYEETIEVWQRLLQPLSPTSKGFWQLESGPAIRVVSAEKDGIRELVINVRSLEQAYDFLMANGLLGVNELGEITISGLYFQGLTVKLMEMDN